MRPAAGESQYVVVARRYRPQSFDELVGQEQVSQALAGAINTNRVGHAYLFTGARGVGKTSTARILAKALNCVDGPTATPCHACDICQSIASGDDVDVIEIDGASNRGIDEIRQLRSNVNVRPSRARFKIYIIDEVHMLTTPAFNALLKTLEEPPQHVKFIFCTTDPEKIPITVLSRCQRFDFPPVESDAIVARLQFIVTQEGRASDSEALHLLARRAGGSMRDSQSLLEQVLAFSDSKITVDDIHNMLGTADSSRLAAIAQSLVSRNAAAAIELVDAAVGEGVDAGQLTEQLLGYFRDVMAATAGCDADVLLHTNPHDLDELKRLGSEMGLETLLAILGILDETLTKMRQSTHVRTLLDIALVRVSKLEDLDQLSNLIAELRSGSPSQPPSGGSRSPAAAPAKSSTTSQKKNAGAAESPTPAQAPVSPRVDLRPDTASEVWTQALSDSGDMTSDVAGLYDRVAISAPNRLVVSFKAEYTFEKERWERPERKSRIEQALSRVVGQPMRVDFEVLPGEPQVPAAAKQVPSKRQRMREVEKHALVREAIEVFDAEVTDIREPR